MAHRQSTTLQLAVSLLLPLAAGALLGIEAQQPVTATQPPQTAPDSSTVTLKVKTRLTIEDITVTDAKGNPVRGLTQGDFIVKEDGKPQQVKDFLEYGASAAQAAPPPLPPGTYTNSQATTPNSVNIFLLDSLTNGKSPFYAPENQMIALKQAVQYLKTMPEGTEVAILKLSNGLRVVQGFTTDRDVLLSAIASVKPEPASGAYLSRPPDGAPRPLEDQICAMMNAQSEITTTALSGIAGFVSGIKGRKNLIWFTPGIPWLTNYILYSNNSCIHDYSEQLSKAYGRLWAAQVAVYPIDPKGLTVGPVRYEDHLSVNDFAANTGGKAYYDRNDLAASIGAAIANGSDYYSLSYVPPPSKYDGRYHTIKVTVDRPGLNLLYRDHYTALDAELPLSDKKGSNKKNPGETAAQPVSQFHAAMEHGPDGNDLKFYVHLQPSTEASSSPETMKESVNPRLKGQPLTQYDFEYVVPAGGITLASDNPSGTQTAVVQLAVAVFSAQGELLNAAGRTVAFPIKQDQTAQFLHNASRVIVQVDLPPGKVFVRAGVFDVASQRWGTVEIPAVP